MTKEPRGNLVKASYIFPLKLFTVFGEMFFLGCYPHEITLRKKVSFYFHLPLDLLFPFPFWFSKIKINQSGGANNGNVFMARK